MSTVILSFLAVFVLDTDIFFWLIGKKFSTSLVMQVLHFLMPFSVVSGHLHLVGVPLIACVFCKADRFECTSSFVSLYGIECKLSSCLTMHVYNTCELHYLANVLILHTNGTT